MRKGTLVTLIHKPYMLLLRLCPPTRAASRCGQTDEPPTCENLVQCTGGRRRPDPGRVRRIVLLIDIELPGI